MLLVCVRILRVSLLRVAATTPRHAPHGVQQLQHDGWGEERREEGPGKLGPSASASA